MMNLDSLGDVGIVGVCVLLILREVFAFLKSREESETPAVDCEEALTKLPCSNRLAPIEDSMAKIAASSASIQAVLEKTDADGLPLVYTPRSLTSAIEGLGKSVDRLEQKLERAR